jgi:hypothetical protein
MHSKNIAFSSNSPAHKNVRPRYIHRPEPHIYFI